MKVYRCDRCGREVDELRVVNVLMQPATGLMIRADAEFDLCEDCADAFEDWLCGKEKDEGGQTKGR